MAKLLLAGPVRRWADRSPGFRKLVWSVETALVWLLAGLLRLLPVDTASAAAGKLMRLLGPGRKKSQVMRDNLRIAFPDKGDEQIDALVRDVWSNAGAVMAEYPHLKTICRDQADDRLQVEIRGTSTVYNAGGRPAVFVSGHFANWELPAAVAASLDIPLAVVYTALQNPGLDRLLKRARKPLGCAVVERQGAMRKLLRNLRNGVSAGLIMDQRVDAGEPLPFFGQERPTSLTAAQLAVKLDLDLIPVQIQRLRGAHFRVVFHEPLRPADPAADAHDKAVQMTREINRLFESWIMEKPGDWYCSKRRWPKPLMRRLLGQKKTV